MRLHHLILGLGLGLLVTGCEPNPPGAGTAGNVCRHFPGQACDDGLNCDNGFCSPCGADHIECCTVAGGSPTCDPGLACKHTGEITVCQDDCGLPGLPCCPDNFSGGDCPGGGVCDLGNQICDGVPSDPCFSGQFPFPVFVVDNLCSAQQVVFMTNTLAQAEECRQQRLVDLAQPDQEVCPVGTKPVDTAVCKQGINGVDQLYLPNCGAAQLEVCEQNFCSDCTWSTGSCP